MNKESIIFKIKEASESDLLNHLIKCNDNFVPPLESRINISEYSEKIFTKAITFEAWNLKDLIGVIAVYFNKETNIAFITNVSVVNEYMGHGIAGKLIEMCINYAEFNKFKEIKLEVNKDNFPAINIYKKHKFTQIQNENDSIFMSYILKNK